MNRKRTQIVFAAVALLAVAVALGGGAAEAVKSKPAAAPTRRTKEQDIREFIKLTGIAEMGPKLIDSVLATFKKTKPGLPDQFWADLRSEFKVEELIDTIVSIYAKHFTHDEMKQILAFQTSPVGVKLRRLQPTIVQEAGVAGRQWGAKVAQRVLKKIRNREEKK